MEEVKCKMEDCHTDSELLTQFHKNTPQLRFSGFDDEWEEKKLGEIVTEFKNPVELPHNGYTRLGIRSHAKGTFHEYVAPGHELEAAQMSEVKADNLIMSITFAWEHAVAITDKNDEGKLVSQRFPQFSFNKGQVPEFYKYVIADEKFRHHLWLSSPGGAGRNRVLNIKESMEYKSHIPSSDFEQQKIGAFLSHVDSLIQAKTKKLESLKAVKKSLLQKCFPKAGAKVPEMRFAGFNGDWEEKKLTDEITLYSGLTYTPKNVCEYGTLVLRSSNVQNGEINLEDQVRVKTEVVNSQNVEKGDIIVVVRNGSKALIGKHAQIKSEMDNTVIGAFMAGIKSKQPEFMNALLSSEKFDHEVEIHLGATINQITNSTFDKMFFYFPSTEEEQQKIGKFFSKYDSLISLQQKEIDKLKDIKKSLLQKMFV